MKNSSFHQIEKIIKKAKRILVVTHQGPDGDAIGSLAAMGFYLKKIKKPHYLLCVSGVPDSLKFIPGTSGIKSKHPKIPYDLIIGLDYGSKIQLGLESYFKKYPEIPVLIFDHHLLGNQSADFGIIKSGCSSVCELLYDYFQAIKFNINKKIAHALAVGILSDTGFFKYTHNKKPLEVSANLMHFGVRPDEIDNALNGYVKMAAMKLGGKILSRAEHNYKKDFVYSWLKRKELSKHHVLISDLNGLIERLRNLKEGRFALFLVEEEKERIHGHLRSRPDKNYNVAKLAMKMGGGGHKYAAGFRFKGTIDTALKLVAKYAKKK
jgi:phosphoesterase RecJ-like protein